MKNRILFLVLCLGAACNSADPYKLIVLNKAANLASIYQAETLELLAQIPTEDGPHEVAISTDGKWAVITNYGGRQAENKLSVIHLKKLEKHTTIELGEHTRPHGVVFIPGSSDRVLVTSEVQKKLIQVNLSTGKVEKEWITDELVSHMVAVHPKGTYAYVANIASGTVSVLDLKTEAVVKAIPTGKGAEGIAISADGKDLWISNRVDNTVSLIDTETLEVVESITTEEFPIRLQFIEGGKKLVSSNALSSSLTVIDVATRKVMQHVPIPLSLAHDLSGRLLTQGAFARSALPIGVAGHPQKPLLYVAAANADKVVEVSTKDWTVQRTIQTAKEPDGMAMFK